MDLPKAVQTIVSHAAATGLIACEDRMWATNRILESIGEAGSGKLVSDGNEIDIADTDATSATPLPSQTCYEALDLLGTRAVENGRAESQEQATSSIMGAIMPRPSEVSRFFNELLAQDSAIATAYLYRISLASDYIKSRQTSRNIKWDAPTRWGDLEITINLSKPEKDPRAIAKAAALSTDDAYPACQLCMENEGYAGRGDDSPLGAHPSRQDLRIARFPLSGETWGLQYSPYAYYEEHCIAMSEEHRPMHIDRSCFANLLKLIEMFPRYFFGSNADLPIVGGSILAHDHFQGGFHTFPMDRAADDVVFELRDFPSVKARTITWPLSVIRLTSDDPCTLADAADCILTVWRGYSDSEASIIASSEGVPHNTITPIARRRDDAFELDLTLRCNITDDIHPMGVFHPRSELHHIKKENIGLIEVMGLAILPPRLERELAAVADALVMDVDSEAGGLELARLDSNELIAPHAAWAKEVAERHPDLNTDNVRQVLREEVGAVFGQVLEDAGVFKWTPEGRAAQQRFIERLG